MPPLIGSRTTEPGVGQATVWGPGWLGLWFDVWKGGQAPGAKAAPPNRVEGGSVHLRCPFFFSTPRRASDAIVGAMQAQRSWLGFGGGALADLEAQPCRLCPTWCRTGRWRSRRPGHRVPKVVVGGMGAAAWTATVTGVRARVVRRRSHLHDIWLSRRPRRLSAEPRRPTVNTATKKPEALAEPGSVNCRPGSSAHASSRTAAARAAPRSAEVGNLRWEQLGKT